MAYTKRFDGRKFEEFRPIEAKVGVISRAIGSAMFKMGKTIALAAVYGPRSMYPRFLQNPEKGVLRCHYNMMPFSCGERVRPGGGRRSKELSMVIEKAILPVIDLAEFPNAVVDVFIEFPQTDSGTRCAGIVAASMALADAGIPMKELVSSVAVGKVGDKLVVDLTKDEEDYEEGAVDIATAYLPGSDKFTLLQLDGKISKEELRQCLELAKRACTTISEAQKEALKAKYESQKVVEDE
ncbi:exosome complex exonuclease Rrp41 [Candidatus Woesearchaeota archaeon]|nr:exosome complex exonuclease Rrp41 [Candidatus Woesearchaeota archaeon]MBW3021902.1 exosome complex exonuclease Rrp41 [Candidatus Woesearchaeota archaeon]